VLQEPAYRWDSSSSRVAAPQPAQGETSSTLAQPSARVKFRVRERIRLFVFGIALTSVEVCYDSSPDPKHGNFFAKDLAMRFLAPLAVFFLVVFSYAAPAAGQQAEEHVHSQAGSQEGVGRVHMDTSCAPAVAAKFDRALALLHNFWYLRALEVFQQVSKDDPECAMAYWGAAMTYNHPFWDTPSAADQSAAWALVQKGMAAKNASPREKLYLNAVAALFKNAGAGPKTARDAGYRNAMARAYARFPDDETRLFYGLAILGTIQEGTKGFDRQTQAAKLFEEAFAHTPNHPGVLHYLIHAYDDPVHAEQGLQAAREYGKAAAAVPHALHMPSHIFTRLGYWDESAATNERAWEISESDVKRAGESGALRDFHSLNYLEYAYLQLGRYRDARKTLDIIAAQYGALPDKKTADDTPELQSRHVRGRTIYAIPDRVVYGYFDMLTRYVVETGDWDAASKIPVVVPSRDFVAVKWQLETMAAATRNDAASARVAAEKLTQIAQESGQHPFVLQIILMQAKEAQAFAAKASGNPEEAVAKMKEAVAIEDSIDSLSQPPYPIIPAHELLGTLLLDLNRFAEAREQFQQTLKRTPGRPKAIYGIARASEASGDTATATQRYQQFLAIWKKSDPDRPELAIAQEFLARAPTSVH
jgi:tetratricopeptide (TPR) repeat protein